MPKTPPTNGGQSIFPPTPSTPAKLPYSKRKLFWPAIFLLNSLLLLLWLVGRAAFWLWQNKWVAAEWAGVLFWRGVTLLGVLWLVYDRLYETDLTISSVASETSNPFRLPFTLTNNSHLFHIKNIGWQCAAVHVLTKNQNNYGVGQVLYGTKNELPPGQTLNIDCNVFGPTSRMVRVPADDTVREASVEIRLDYTVNIWGFSLERHPKTVFTYFPASTYSQWVRGPFAK